MSYPKQKIEYDVNESRYEKHKIYCYHSEASELGQAQDFDYVFFPNKRLAKELSQASDTWCIYCARNKQKISVYAE